MTLPGQIAYDDLEPEDDERAARVRADEPDGADFYDDGEAASAAEDRWMTGRGL